MRTLQYMPMCVCLKAWLSPVNISSCQDFTLPKPQLGEHVKQKRPLGPTGVGFLPLESITQVQIDGE